jgi:hypothetical protein
MNERIKELALEAGKYADETQPRGSYTRDGMWLYAYNEKFAELIVQECAKTVNDTEYPYEDPAHKETWDACCVWSAEKLKEHFGVEE